MFSQNKFVTLFCIFISILIKSQWTSSDMIITFFWKYPVYIPVSWSKPAKSGQALPENDIVIFWSTVESQKDLWYGPGHKRYPPVMEKKWFNLHWLQYSYFSIFCRNMEGIYFKCFVVVTDSSVARLVFYICFISPYISDKYFCIYVNLFFTRIFKVYTCCHYQHYFCCCYQQIL